MKCLLFVLIVLVLSGPAMATVCVYNINDAITWMDYHLQDSNSVWDKYVLNYKGYFIVGPGSTSDTAHIWAIWMITKKGNPYKYYEVEDWNDINLPQVSFTSGKKTTSMWIISRTTYRSQTVLMGDCKIKKIGNHKKASCIGAGCHSNAVEMAAIGDIDPNIPSKMTGYMVLDGNYGDTARDVRKEKITLTFNAKETIKNHQLGNLDAASVKDELVTEIEEAGYIEP